jgi:response regulator of citrate/malate metabolism
MKHGGRRRPPKENRLIQRVLDAVNGGAETSPDVAQKVGIARSSASAWLSQLERLGAVECTGIQPSAFVGRPRNIYAAKRFHI